MSGGLTDGYAGREVPQITLSPGSAYDVAELMVVDAAFVTASPHADAAEEGLLAHMRRRELGSVRHKDALGVYVVCIVGYRSALRGLHLKN